MFKNYNKNLINNKNQINNKNNLTLMNFNTNNRVVNNKIK